MRRIVALTSLLALTACPGNGNGTDLPEGCITVNGSRGFQFLADAMTVTEPGDTVQLCGEITDTLVIDRPITFESPFNMDGAFTSLWTPPDNEPAIRIVEGGEVTMDGIYIETTRNGITVEEGGILDVSRTYIEVDNPGSYGIEIVNGEVTADTLIINQAFWGAIQNTGGTLTLRNSDLVNSFRWGVRLDNGATATIEDTLIGGTRISDETGENNDGWAVYVCDTCSVTMRDVDLESNILGGLYVNLGIADVEGGTWTGNFMGGWIDGGTATITDVDIIDPLQYGIVGLSGNVTLNDVRMDADPESSPFEDVTTSNLEGGYGLLAIDGEVTWIGGGATEFNGGGIFALGNQAAQLPLVLQELSIADNSAVGIQTSLADLEATDVKITGTVSVPDICQANFTYSCDWGLAAFQSDVDWVGGSIRDNDAMGAVIGDGPSDFTGIELANNGLYGIWSIQGVVNLADADVHGIGEIAVFGQDGSFITVDNTSFHDRDHVVSFGEPESENRFGFQAFEVLGVDSTVEVSNSTFRNGNNGIRVSGGSTLSVIDSSFRDYNENGVSAVSGSSMEIETTDFTGFGGNVISCSSTGSSTSVSRVNISDVTTVKSLFEFWQDGELTSSNLSEFTRPAMSMSSCSLEASRVTFTDVSSQAIDLSNVTVDELDRVTITGANIAVAEGRIAEPAIDVVWNSAAPEFSASDVTITGVPAGTAMRLQSVFEVPDGIASEVRLEEITIGDAEGIGGVGLDLTGLTDFAMSEFTITNTGAEGLIARTTNGTLGSEDGPSTISGTGANGLFLDDSRLVVSNVDVTSSTTDGVRVTAGGSSFDTVSISGAGGFGMSCVTGPEVPVCTNVTAAGASGEHDGCGACFGEEPAPTTP